MSNEKACPPHDNLVPPSSDKDTRFTSNIRSILNALRTANENSSTPSLFVGFMRECQYILDQYSCDSYRTLVSLLFNSKSFNEMLERLIFHSIVPEFTKRDYFSYDKNDFEGQSQITECTLEFLIKFLSGLKASNEEDHNEADRKTSINVICQKVISHLPNILLLIAGNATIPIWSSKECQQLSLQLLHIVLKLFGFTTVADLFSLTFTITLNPNIKNVSFKYSDKTLLSYLLYYFEEPLSKERWEKNPFLCESFLWIIAQLTSTQMSLYVNQVLAVALSFLHNYDSSNKLRGIQLLNCLIHSVSNEELRWYNRAEVIYEALKTHIYLKERLVLDAVIQCVFSILKILEKSNDSRKRHHFILSTLLSNAENEDLLDLRRIYISHLAQFFLDCGVLCIGHLGSILRVIDKYLEVEDGPEEIARMSALDALQNIIKVSWPRIALHSTFILKFLLKFVININSPLFVEMKGESLKKKAEDKVINCFKLLSKINPYVIKCVEALQKSGHKVYLNGFLKALCHSL